MEEKIKKPRGKRIKATKIGDVFVAKFDNQYKKYFQLIAFDTEQMTSDVVRVFKAHYPMDANPDLDEIINDKVELYAHCCTRAGLKYEQWEMIGNINNVGNVKNIVFRTIFPAFFFEPENDSYFWKIWKINKSYSIYKKLNNKQKKAYIGLIFSPQAMYSIIKDGGTIFD